MARFTALDADVRAARLRRALWVLLGVVVAAGVALEVLQLFAGLLAG